MLSEIQQTTNIYESLIRFFSPYSGHWITGETLEIMLFVRPE